MNLMRCVIFFWGVLVLPAALVTGEEANLESALREAMGFYDAGDFEGVLRLVEPLLQRPPGAPQEDLVRDIAVSTYQRRGERHFQNARIAESIEDFDRVIALVPEEEAGHWQRGIAYYYAGRYEEGVKQFELHRTVNPQDVENSVWHFLCNLRLLGGDLEKAREELIPVDRDPRIPMREVLELFRGETTPEAVLAAAAGGGENAKFFADLYLGLYDEAMGKTEEAMAYMARAAQNPTSRHYMGDVARTHLLVRHGEAQSGE